MKSKEYTFLTMYTFNGGLSCSFEPISKRSVELSEIEVRPHHMLAIDEKARTHLKDSRRILAAQRQKNANAQDPQEQRYGKEGSGSFCTSSS